MSSIDSSSLPHLRPTALAGRHFSCVIVGGGINGVGVFRDLSLQGIDCLIVDKGDFAAGASSAPSRMIHGGLRYLESGGFSLVAEATRERNLLLRNAPHLVRPLETVVPLSSHFGGLLSSMLRFFGITTPTPSRGLIVVALGLRLYDLLGRRQRVMPGHRIRRVAANDGALFRPEVRWTATYFDAWISHPEWLILELLADAGRDQPQAAAANYCRMVALEGKTLSLRDELSGELVQVTADAVVNATGAWLDLSAAALGGAAERIMGTKGSHLVLDHPVLARQLEGRMAYFEASDGRVCIVYPFLDRVLVGSTDIPVDDPDEAVTEAPEIDYLLEVLREVFPQLGFSRDHVIYTYVGVRPLARSDANNPGKISREHSVAIDPPNARRQVPLVCLVGGKWTTFRALSEQAADEVLRLLGKPRLQSTEALAIGGGAQFPPDTPALNAFVDRMVQGGSLSRARAAELVGRYGSRAPALAAQFTAAGDVPLRHAPGYSSAEIAYLCRQTGVMHLSDLVIRRTLLAIRGLVTDNLLAELAEVVGQALGWDATRRRREIHSCTTTLRDRHFVRLAPAPHGSAPFDASSAVAPRPSPLPT